MSQRKSVNGRPSGTDGSDFSYRMVVDSRYKKVAEGKSRLCAWIFTQGFIQFLGAVVLFISTVEGGTLDRLSVSSGVIFFISLLIGELGRKRSRVNLLKLYLFGSSVAALISVACLLKSEKSIELEMVLSFWSNLLYRNCEKTDPLYICTGTNLMREYIPNKRLAPKIIDSTIKLNNKLPAIDLIIKDMSRWEKSKLELSKIATVLLSVIMHIFAVGVTTSLIRNMAPPKRAF